jgi:tetratricopeptide (TPR) repeat protein
VSTKVAQLLLLSAAIGCVGWSHARIPLTTRADLGEAFVPSPTVARGMAFGFDALVADYHWLQAVQVVGGSEEIDAEVASHIGRLIDVVTTLNPHVSHPYRFAALWLTHDEALVREGIRLLERAIEYHPDDWRNYFYLGFNHFYYLGEHEEAARVLEQATKLPGAPAYLPRLVARLKSQHGDVDVAEVFLRELLRSALDEEARAKVQGALDEIEIEYKARHLDQARAAHRALFGRDIEAVEDLVRGEHRVLEKLPSPEPEALPPSLARGSIWQIDPETDRIISSYIGSRYEVHYSPADRARLRAWRGDGVGSEQGEAEDDAG